MYFSGGFQILAQTAMVLSGLRGDVEAMAAVSARWAIPVWRASPCCVCMACVPPGPVHRCKAAGHSHRADAGKPVTSLSGLLGACFSGDVGVVKRMVSKFEGCAAWLSAARAGPITAEVTLATAFKSMSG